jgi:hypothetical protein
VKTKSDKSNILTVAQCRLACTQLPIADVWRVHHRHNCPVSRPRPDFPEILLQVMWAIYLINIYNRGVFVRFWRTSESAILRYFRQNYAIKTTMTM